MRSSRRRSNVLNQRFEDMPRARNIKPQFFKDADLGEVSLGARLLFAGLWTLADCEGRLSDDPRWIKIEIFPYNAEITPAGVEAYLAELATGAGRKGFILRYQVGSERFIQVVNFRRHQNPHPHEKNQGSKIPGYELATKTDFVITSNVKAVTSRADSLFLIPDSLIPDSKTICPNGCLDDKLPRQTRLPIDEPAAGDPSVRDTGAESPRLQLEAKQQEWFAEWWATYWRKVARKKAEIAFNKKVKSQERFDEVKRATEKQRGEMMSRDPENRPHGATWLNGERWEDECDPAREGTVRQTKADIWSRA